MEAEGAGRGGVTSAEQKASTSAVRDSICMETSWRTSTSAEMRVRRSEGSDRVNAGAGMDFEDDDEGD